MKSTQILLVDDDPSIRKFIRANLEARHYEVLSASDGEECIKIFEQELPDLVLLDIMMPKMDGFEVCKKIREWSNVPIIMLSARDNEMDKVKCLDAGADDYLTKPFSLKELLSRINAVLRRCQGKGKSSQSSMYVFDDLKIDFLQYRVYASGKEVRLTPTEYNLLSYMASNAGRVITMNQLLEKVWGDAYTGDFHILQVHIARLRKKIGDNGSRPKYIWTRNGIGYLMLKNSQSGSLFQTSSEKF